MNTIPCKITEYSGGFDVELPRSMISELVSMGDQHTVADKFATSLAGFRSFFNRKLAIELLEPHGPWYGGGLDKLSTKEIQNTLLWIIALQAEQSDVMTRTHITCYIGD